MKQYQADFSLNRKQRLEVFCFASSVSGTRNFDQFRLKGKKKHVVYKVCCNLPRWYKWNIVLFLHKIVLLLIYALELKFILFFSHQQKYILHNQFSIQCKWSLCLNLFLALLKEQRRWRCNGLLYFMLLSIIFWQMLEWGVKCFLIVIKYLVMNVYGVTWKMVF